MVTVDADLLLAAMLQGYGGSLPPDLGRAAIPANVLRWLRANLHHPELLRFIEAESWAQERQLCAGYMASASGIMERTEEFKALGSRYIVLGTAPNGDPIVVPRKSLDTIGFVDHEDFDDEADVVKYIPVDTSIGRLYYNSWNVEGYPSCYFEAEEREGT